MMDARIMGIREWVGLGGWMDDAMKWSGNGKRGAGGWNGRGG